MIAHLIESCKPVDVPINSNFKIRCPDFLTWMEDSRPGKSTLGVTFCVESDFQVENAQILHLDLKN